MKSYVITIRNDTISNGAAETLIQSSKKVGNEFDIAKYDAVTPDRVKSLMNEYKLRWTYPWDIEGPRYDLASGLYLNPYVTADPKKRIACFLSHYLLWKECAESNEPYLIFEHDAEFIKRLDIEPLIMSKYSIIGLNDPRGATRKAQLYYEMVRNGSLDIVAVPKIDDDRLPQGLAGNSAYLIKPAGARKLLYAVKEYGAWPNDSTMCKQLLPNQLGVVRDFVTKVQGIKSTTTL